MKQLFQPFHRPAARTVRRWDDNDWRNNTGLIRSAKQRLAHKLVCYRNKKKRKKLEWKKCKRSQLLVRSFKKPQQRPPPLIPVSVLTAFDSYWAGERWERGGWLPWRPAVMCILLLLHGADGGLLLLLLLWQAQAPWCTHTHTQWIPPAWLARLSRGM